MLVNLKEGPPGADSPPLNLPLDRDQRGAYLILLLFTNNSFYTKLKTFVREEVRPLTI